MIMETDKSIAAICRYNTDLRTRDIEYLEKISIVLKTLANLEDADVFIDAPTRNENAIVVAEAKPDYVPSSYKNSVVGMMAKPQNEPAVARTLRLGEATKQMKALTQENTNVIQTVEPLINEGRIVGVLICEKRVDDDRTLSDTLHFSEESYEKIVKTITHMANDEKYDNSWLTECIDEALIIVDNDGIVNFRNSLAAQLYKRLGYVNDILGQNYKNVALTEWNSFAKEDLSGLTEVEVNLGDVFLLVRRVSLSHDENSFALIIRDVTEKKEREKELVLKSVAIQEMHHRVKNNLQTIASLLRLQSRRAKDEETRKVLQESMNRILAIAVTHEILSQVGVDSVDLSQVIANIKNNTLRYFADSGISGKINVVLKGDTFKVSANTMTSIALVVNELLQNSLEHAFKGREKGSVQVITTHGVLYSTIRVIDDGVGFDSKNTQNSNLGLSIVKSLVCDKLGGNFTIKSGPTGTCAEFDFKVS